MADQDSLQSTPGKTGSSSLSTASSAAEVWGKARLPGGVDFAAVRVAIGIRETLQLLDWRAVSGREPQLRGPCPVHRSENPRSTSFSVNLAKNAFQCFGCGCRGNQLDLFATATGLPLYLAAVELCLRMGVEPPRTAAPPSAISQT